MVHYGPTRALYKPSWVGGPSTRYTPIQTLLGTILYDFATSDESCSVPPGPITIAILIAIIATAMVDPSWHKVIRSGRPWTDGFVPRAWASLHWCLPHASGPAATATVTTSLASSAASVHGLCPRVVSDPSRTRQDNFRICDVRRRKLRIQGIAMRSNAANTR